MALKEEFSRMQEKIITGAGIVPTVPADLTDVPKDTWLSTDLMTGEICVNPDDDKVWTRTSAGITELVTSPGGSVDLQEVLDAGSVASIAGDVDLTTPNLKLTGDLEMGTTNIVKSINGNAQLELDSGGVADTVMLSTNAGSFTDPYLLLDNLNSQANLKIGTEGIIIDAGLTTISHSTNVYIESSLVNINDDDLKIEDNSAAPVTTTNTAKNAVIIAAQNSTIDTGITNSSIISGNLNNISDGDNNSIIAGNNNIIDVAGENFAIIGGQNNNITIASGVYENGVIIGGTNNDIDDGSNNVILGGTTNTNSGSNAAIISSLGSINGSTTSVILGGTSNTISNIVTSASGILAGDNNIITGGSAYSSIIGGDTNDITNFDRSVILGGANISADANDTVFAENLRLEVGGRLRMLSGTNACAGSATLVAGTVVINTTKVQANSLIMLTHQNNAGTPGFVSVTARTAGTSFTITSSSATDTSSIGWVIIDQS